MNTHISHGPRFRNALFLIAWTGALLLFGGGAYLFAENMALKRQPPEARAPLSAFTPRAEAAPPSSSGGAAPSASAAASATASANATAAENAPHSATASASATAAENAPAPAPDFAGADSAASVTAKAATQSAPAKVLDPVWIPLIMRLSADGFDTKKTMDAFAGLGLFSYSPAFMAAKVMELHGASGVGIKRSPEGEVTLPEGYAQPISDMSLGSCRAFMKEHAEVLADIRKTHGVPANIIVGLLLVETGLGSDLGSDPALRSLGSMAMTSSAAMLGSAGNRAQIKKVHASALQATLRDKSAWAYNELKALIRYGEGGSTDLSQMPGSMYGAIGLCQFMPSNIEPYAVDGDKDGRIDLFSVVDAMYSVANYLESHGWRGAKDSMQQFFIIRTYNHDNFYAARVLGAANQLTLAEKGKLSNARHALAGVGPVPASALDPSLSRRRIHVPQSAKIKSLNDYGSILNK